MFLVTGDSMNVVKLIYTMMRPRADEDSGHYLVTSHNSCKPNKTVRLRERFYFVQLNFWFTATLCDSGSQRPSVTLVHSDPL